MKRFCILPAYNPPMAFLKTVEELASNNLSIVIVDDGSTDEFMPLFVEVSTRFGEFVTLLRHARNKGKGAALKTGLKYLHDNATSDYVVLTIDADGQHNVVDGLNVLAETTRNNNPTLGVRSFAGRVPMRSKLGNVATIRIFNTLTGMKLLDTQTGMRAFHSDQVDLLLSVPGSRYDWETNVLLKISGMYDVNQVPIETIYEAGNPSSHFRKVTDSILIYRYILLFCLIGILSVVLDYIIFVLLMSLGTSAGISVTISKSISSVFNYAANHKRTFQSKKPILGNSLVVYYVLAVANIAILYTVLENRETTVGYAVFLKAFAEIALFFVNFYILKLFYSPKES